MKQIPKLYVTGLLLVLVATVSWALADSAADLKQAEKLYENAAYPEAEQLYEKILTDTEQAKAEGVAVDADLMFEARKKLPAIYLATDRQAQAKASVEILLDKHADREDLPHALHEIVEGAKKIDKTSQAGQICLDILTADPKHKQALWLKMGVALANVYLKDDQAVKTVIESIVAEQGTDPWAAEALAQTGSAYDKLKRHDKSRPIYEYIVDTWPQKRRTIEAHTALVRTCIFLKDEEAAQVRLEQLVERYVKNDRLPSVLTQICRDYREMKMYQPSQQVSRYVLENFPENDH
jgi:tetratricopeptide (TPR) repeat protein